MVFRVSPRQSDVSDCGGHAHEQDGARLTESVRPDARAAAPSMGSCANGGGYHHAYSVVSRRGLHRACMHYVFGAWPSPPAPPPLWRLLQSKGQVEGAEAAPRPSRGHHRAASRGRRVTEGTEVISRSRRRSRRCRLNGLPNSKNSSVVAMRPFAGLGVGESSSKKLAWQTGGQSSCRWRQKNNPNSEYILVDSTTKDSSKYGPGQSPPRPGRHRPRGRLGSLRLASQLPLSVQMERRPSRRPSTHSTELAVGGPRRRRRRIRRRQPPTPPRPPFVSGRVHLDRISAH